MLTNSPEPRPEATGPSQVRVLDSDRRRIFRWGFIAFWGGIVLAALMGIVGDAVGEVVPRLGGMIENLAGLGGLVLLIGIGIMIYSRLVPKTQQSPPLFLPTANPVNPVNAVNALNAIGESPISTQTPPLASVTEHTTYKLDATKRSRS